MLRIISTIIRMIQYIYALVVTTVFLTTKWSLRKLTKLCELQRIIYGELRGSKRTRRVESSLFLSRNPQIKEVLAELEKGTNDGRFDLKGTRKALVTRCSVNIARAKEISLKSHSRFVNALTDCLELMYAYKCLNVKLEMLRTTAYSHDSAENEAKLYELWHNFMYPDLLSGRKSRQWQILGFQGNDPATDFRGAGMLALDALIFMSRNYPEVSTQLLKNSHHPLYSYPFALLSIQITYMAADLFRQGKGKTHFYNRVGVVLNLDERAGPNDRTMWGEELLYLFFEFCCALMIEFDSYWFQSKPKDIMEFGRVKSSFDKYIMKKLDDDATCFLMEVRTI